MGECKGPARGGRSLCLHLETQSRRKQRGWCGLCRREGPGRGLSGAQNLRKHLPATSLLHLRGPATWGCGLLRGGWVQTGPEGGPGLGSSGPPHCAAPTPRGPLLSDGLQGLPVGTRRGRPPGSHLQWRAGASRPWPVPQAGQCPSPRTLGGGGWRAAGPRPRAASQADCLRPFPLPALWTGGTGLRPLQSLNDTPPPQPPQRVSLSRALVSGQAPAHPQSPPPRAPLARAIHLRPVTPIVCPEGCGWAFAEGAEDPVGEGASGPP